MDKIYEYSSRQNRWLRSDSDLHAVFRQLDIGTLCHLPDFFEIFLTPVWIVVDQVDFAKAAQRKLVFQLLERAMPVMP